MSGKFFLDTNILVYSFDRGASSKQNKAIELIEEALQSGLGVISYQVVQEFLNVALTKFAVPLSTAEAQGYLISVLRPLCRVTSSISLTDSAIRLHERYKFSFYDTLIIASAIEADCKVLYSEDLSHRMKLEGLEIIDPFV
jgi:predicted nucleic acid-binding protein